MFIKRGLKLSPKNLTILLVLGIVVVLGYNLGSDFLSSSSWETLDSFENRTTSCEYRTQEFFEEGDFTSAEIQSDNCLRTIHKAMDKITALSVANNKNLQAANLSYELRQLGILTVKQSILAKTANTQKESIVYQTLINDKMDLFSELSQNLKKYDSTNYYGDFLEPRIKSRTSTEDLIKKQLALVRAADFTKKEKDSEVAQQIIPEEGIGLDSPVISFG